MLRVPRRVYPGALDVAAGAHPPAGCVDSLPHRDTRLCRETACPDGTTTQHRKPCPSIRHLLWPQ